MLLSWQKITGSGRQEKRIVLCTFPYICVCKSVYIAVQISVYACVHYAYMRTCIMRICACT